MFYSSFLSFLLFFFFNDTATTEIYTLSLHDALPISPICLFFVSKVKNTFHYDDALDVFGVHCIGGITGALATGLLVSPALGGVCITDYTNIADNYAGKYDLVAQMIAQG